MIPKWYHLSSMLKVVGSFIDFQNEHNFFMNFRPSRNFLVQSQILVIFLSFCQNREQNYNFFHTSYHMIDRFLEERIFIHPLCKNYSVKNFDRLA